MTVGNKSRSVRLPSVKITTVYKKNGGGLSGQPTIQPIATRCTFPIGKQWSGGNNPDWRKLIRAGKNATNTYDVTFNAYPSELQYASAKYLWKDYSGTEFAVVDYKYCSVPDISGETAVDIALRKSVTNEAMGKMYARLNDEMQAINGYAFLGEIRKTLKMLRRPAESMAKLIGTYKSKSENAKRLHYLKLRALKKPSINSRRAQVAYDRKVKKIQHEAKTLSSNLWLEFKFGVEPLAGDIAAAAGAYFDYTNKYQRPIFKVVTARAVQTGVQSRLGYYEVPYGVYTHINNEFTRTTKVKLVTIIDMDATYSRQTEAKILSSKFDLGLPAVIPALWDLTPLSLFVDYFADVSTVLTAVCAVLPEIVSVDRRVEETLTVETSTILSGFIYAGGVLKPETPGYSKVSKTHYLREQWALSIPTLVFTTPLGSPIKLGNLAAFLNNVLNKSK